MPELIAAMIDTALALNPEKRFISARAMWNALEEISKADEAVLAAAHATSTTFPEEATFPALEAFEGDAEFSPGAAEMRSADISRQMTSLRPGLNEKCIAPYETCERFFANHILVRML